MTWDTTSMQEQNGAHLRALNLRALNPPCFEPLVL
jgi:hypothetical protein